MKEKITAVRWMFGFTNAEAKKYISLAPGDCVDAIVECWLNQTNKTFKED